MSHCQSSSVRANACRGPLIFDCGHQPDPAGCQANLIRLAKTFPESLRVEMITDGIILFAGHGEILCVAATILVHIIYAMLQDPLL